MKRPKPDYIGELTDSRDVDQEAVLDKTAGFVQRGWRTIKKFVRENLTQKIIDIYQRSFFKIKRTETSKIGSKPSPTV